MIDTKKCSLCKKIKNAEDFFITGGKLRSQCKVCHTEAVMRGRQNNKRKCTQEGCDNPHYGRGYCRRHHGRFIRGARLDTIFVGETSHPRNLRKYGLTQEEFDQMSKDGCQICGVNTAPLFVIDHDHACCNEVPYCGECTRGYVCHSCNLTISKYEYNTMRQGNPLRDSVIQYLQKYQLRRQRFENIKVWHDIIVDPDNKREEW